MDRLTELQYYLDSLAQLFYTSLGVIQRDAAPSNLNFQFPKKEKSEETMNSTREYITDEQIQSLAIQIVQTSKTIEQYIESLPGIEATENEQMESLLTLQKQNSDLTQQLKEKVKECENFLLTVRNILQQIIDDKISESLQQT
jgi:mediator of RNA polymerase II transcription subunit 21